MPHIQTALGPIDAADLGFTLSHEHAGMRVPLTRHYYPWLDALELQREGSIRELREAKAGGVDAIIELSTPDLGRDAALLAEISRESGVHMVVATGLWRDLPVALDAMDPDEIADIFVREIEVGIEETGVRAGVIKVANDAEGVTARGERVLRAAGRAASARTCRSARTTGRRWRWAAGSGRSSTTRACRRIWSASATAPTRRTWTTWRIC